MEGQKDQDIKECRKWFTDSDVNEDVEEWCVRYILELM